jgi:predicted ATP-grasp superfamily ATP-dependent carboligase
VIWGDLNLLRCFAGSGTPTWIVTSDERDVTLRSRLCRSSSVIAPPRDEERAASDLVLLGSLFPERPVLFYGTDAALLVISRNRHELGRYFRFRMPRPELIEQLVNKQLFTELALRSELPVPRTLASDEIESAADIERHVGLPCVFKPSVHIGWFDARARHGLSPHKALRVETSEELARALAELRLHCESFVVQQYIPGGEELIYSYHSYVDERFRPLGEFAGRKLRTYPKHAGVSTYLELVHEPALLALGRDVIERIGLVGPVKLDFKRAADTGQFNLLEVNPRYTLWNHLGAVAGVNLPRIAYADLTGGAVSPACAYRAGVRWLSFGNDLRAFLRDYRPEGMSTAQWLRSFRAPKVYDIFSWSDPLPFVANALKFTGALSRRLLKASLG